MFKSIILLFIFLTAEIFAQNADLEKMKEDVLQKSGKEKVDLLCRISFEHWNISPEAGINYGTEALSLARKIEYPFGEAKALNSMGVNYWSKANYEKALESFQESMVLSEKINDATGISHCLNNMGLIYAELKKYEKSLEYFFKSLEMDLKQKDEMEIASCYNNIGSIYQKKGDLKEALEFLNKALDIKKKNNDKRGMASTLVNMGEVYKEKKQYDDALNNYSESLEILKEIGQNKGKIIPMIEIASLYISKGDVKKAEMYLDQSLILANELEAKDHLVNIYLNYSDLFFTKSDYKNSLKFFKKYTELKDELFSEESNKRIEDMQIKYDTSEKNRKIALLTKEKENQQLMLVIAIVIISSFIVLTGVLFALFRTKKKTALLLNKLSRTDTLTGLLNRRAMNEAIANEIGRVQRSKKVFSLIIADIDHFKKFNDTYGHDCGDEALKCVSEILKKNVRAQDVICRWGGEEFLFLLPETVKEGGYTLAEKLREKIEAYSFVYNKQSLKITMSFGVQSLLHADSVDETIKRADAALYDAKKQGRNRVVINDEKV